MWNFIIYAWVFIQGAFNFFESMDTIAGPYMSFDDDIETLKRKFRALCCLADDVKGKLANAESSFAKKAPTRVENWLADVGKLGNKVDILLHEAEGLTLVAIWSRIQCVKQAKDLIKEVEELLKEGEFPQGFTENTHPAREHTSADLKKWFESAKDRLQSADPEELFESVEELFESVEELFESAKDSLESADPEEWFESAKDRLQSTDPEKLFKSAKYHLRLLLEDF